jgi:hypothetical protein
VAVHSYGGDVTYLASTSYGGAHIESFYWKTTQKTPIKENSLLPKREEEKRDCMQKEKGDQAFLPAA